MTARVLAVETATEACSAAVVTEERVFERFDVRPRAHLQLLLPMVEAVMEEAGIKLTDLDAIGFGCGPGGFTGLRIATGIAQGLALGAGVPLVAVSNLATLAFSAFADSDASRALVCQDARMGEVYWATFERGPDDRPVALASERLDPPSEVEVEGGGWLGIGSGWMAFPEMRARFDGRVCFESEPRWPRARDVAVLAMDGLRAGRTVAPERAGPVYLRRGVA